MQNKRKDFEKRKIITYPEQDRLLHTTYRQYTVHRLKDIGVMHALL